VGDDIYVSGQLGDARLALEVFRGHAGLGADLFACARDRMELPTPRVALGIALRGLATSAIDVSDGLVGDLGHVLVASQVGATLDVDAVASRMLCGDAVAPRQRRAWTLAGGDDYELAFTAPPAMRDRVQAAAAACGTPVTRIGIIEAAPGLRLVDAQGRAVAADATSFDHFA
jgi:thiamine-monophosphate kinase